MMARPRPRLVPLLFGALPIKAINAALGLELDEGYAVMSINAQRHAQRRHPEDFARCFPHVASVVGNPLYVRDDFTNHGKTELIGHPPALGNVAVEIVQDREGKYNVASFYPVSDKKVARRRNSGHLRRVLPR